MSELQPRATRIHAILLAVILAIGIFLRITPEAFVPGASFHFLAPLHPQPAFTILGFDEGLYQKYVNSSNKVGLGAYPQIVDVYIEQQKTLTGSILPPVRFLYIFTSYFWGKLFGCSAIDSLHQVASFFSMLTLGLATLFVGRIRGPIWAIAIAALMAFAPTQLHMSQHALVDGFFTFWATLVLWLFWENLKTPRDWRWLVPYLLSLSLLVLTKENSAFVWFACVVLMVANRWLEFGTVTRELVVATIVGPILGAVALIFVAGGVPTLLETYHLSVSKNFMLGYAIRTGDGPWYRYLVDLLLVSPIVLILAFGTIFRLNRTMKPELFMSIFIAASYLIMCNLKYGMNLRYANMWDMPLRFLAFSQIVWLASFVRQFRGAIVATAVVLLAALEFHQYIVLAVHYPLYELITHDLLEALRILKSP